MDVEASIVALAVVIFIAGIAAGAWIASLVLGFRHRIEADRATNLARREALASSRRVIRGQVSEQFAPILAGFDFDPADARFLGNPVDFVVFDGLADGALREVVLVEVKSGAARLSEGQRRIRDAVEAGAVGLGWREVRVAGGE